MTLEEWAEIVQETERRWPGQWTPEQTKAYYHDLKPYSAIDVWAAWHKLNASGLEFAPKGSRLLAGTIEERHRSAERELYDHHPELTAGDMSWRQYALMTYGRPLSLLEAVQLEQGGN